MGDEHSRGDRRKIVRIRTYPADFRDVHLYMVNGGERIAFEGTIENLSLGGLFVTARGEVPPGHEFSADIRFTGGRRLVLLKGVVVHRLEPDEHFRGRGLGIAFRSLSVGDRREIKRFFASALERARVRSRTRSGKVHMDDPAGIIRTLMRAANKEVELRLVGHDSGIDFGGRIDTFGTTEIDLLVPDSLPALPPVREPGTVRFNLYFRSYDFDTVVLETHAARGNKPRRVRLKAPVEMWLNDKRNRKRSGVPGNAPEWFEITSPVPGRPDLRFRVLERTDGGLSFRVDADAPYFFGGTPLRQVRVVRDDEVVVEKEHALVRHVSVVPNSGGALRIGIELGAGQSIVPTSHTRVLVPNTRRAKAAERIRQARFVATRWWQRLFPPSDDPAAPRDLHKLRYANADGKRVVGLLNRTFTTPRRVPVVVIPTAFSRRKESTSGLALTLVENFRRHLEHVAVVRFDYTNAVGESEKDPGHDVEGKEYLHYTTSGTLKDLRATFDFIEKTDLFEASQVILVSFSLNSLTARILLADKAHPHPVTCWFAPMGVADAQDAIKNCSGDIDYIEEHQKGVKHGASNILGSIVDMDRYCADLIALRGATLEDAKRDMATIDVPVTWLVGTTDGWVDPQRVEDILSVDAPAPRDLHRVEAGHMPTQNQALPYFNLLTELVFKHVHGREITATPPPYAELKRIHDIEWESTPKQILEDQQGYWDGYLVPEEGGGFDVLRYAPEYTDLLLLQARMLDLRAGQVVMDLGCGTGNFLAELLENGTDYLPDGHVSFHLADFSSQGLQRAETKITPLANANGNVDVSFTQVDLDLSRARIVQRFREGEEPDFRVLQGRIGGLHSRIVDKLSRGYSRRLHRVLRGETLTAATESWLESTYEGSELEVILELNRAARFFTGELEPTDLTDPAGVQPEDAHFGDLAFRRLDFGGNPSAMALPFEDESCDRVLFSLVLSYMTAPDEVLLDVWRILRPGGRIVISSMRPDTESSLIYRRLVDRVKTLTDDELPDGLTAEDMLRSARTYATTASSLVRLAEEGTFIFFDRAQLRRMLEEAGFTDIRVRESFGNPAQAWVATGVKA